MTHILSILSGGSQASADRPNRFISDDKRGELISFATLQRTTDLRFNSFQCLTRLAFFFALTDTHNGDHLKLDNCGDLGCNDFISFSEVLTTLTVPANHILHAEFAQKSW